MSEPAEVDRFKRFARLLTRGLGSLLVGALIVGSIGHVQTAAAARGRVFTNAAQTPRRSVAIVLGALVHRSGQLSDVVADRVACGAELYRHGRVDRVLVSGDHGHKGYDEVSAMGAALIRRGVPASRVFLDHAGFRTLDTMQRAREVFGIRDASICSQRFHLPRSIYLAQRFGIDAVGVIADRRRYRGETYNRVREHIASAVAVLDGVTGRQARLLGPPISLAGDARVTHDRPL